jgi:hypothetical protein
MLGCETAVLLTLVAFVRRFDLGAGDAPDEFVQGAQPPGAEGPVPPAAERVPRACPYRPGGWRTTNPGNSPPPRDQRVPYSASATVSNRQPAIVIQT